MVSKTQVACKFCETFIEPYEECGCDGEILEIKLAAYKDVAAAAQGIADFGVKMPKPPKTIGDVMNMSIDGIRLMNLMAKLREALSNLPEVKE